MPNSLFGISCQQSDHWTLSWFSEPQVLYVSPRDWGSQTLRKCEGLETETHMLGKLSNKEDSSRWVTAYVPEAMFERSEVDRR